MDAAKRAGPTSSPKVCLRPLQGQLAVSARISNNTLLGTVAPFPVVPIEALQPSSRLFSFLFSITIRCFLDHFSLLASGLFILLSNPDIILFHGQTLILTPSSRLVPGSQPHFTATWIVPSHRQSQQNNNPPSPSIPLLAHVIKLENSNRHFSPLFPRFLTYAPLDSPSPGLPVDIRHGR